MSNVTYEWDVETVTDDEHAEVIDHDHRDTYAEALAASQQPPPDGCRFAVVLVRDDHRTGGNRSWAYIRNGQLPTWFTDANGCDGAQVPQRFHAEVARASK